MSGKVWGKISYLFFFFYCFQTIPFAVVCLFSSVQFSRSVVSDSATPWIAARQASLSITNSQSLFKLMPIESVMPSSHLIFCHPLLLLPPTPPSIRVFSNESTLRMRWPKYWSFSFSISPSSEHPGLISFRIDWLNLLAVQGTLKSLFQHHTVQKHQFFGAQLSSQTNSHIRTWPTWQWHPTWLCRKVQLFSRPFSLVKWDNNWENSSPRLKWSLSCQVVKKKIGIEGRYGYKINRFRVSQESLLYLSCVFSWQLKST